MRNFLADFDLFAASANVKEAALNTTATIDTSFQCDKGNIFSLTARRETNEDSLLGHHESDRVYDLGNLSEMVVDFKRAEAQHFAFLLSYAFGSSTPAAYGTGYQHTIVPTEEMILPTFSGIFRYGKDLAKRRFSGCLVESMTSTFAKDSWAVVTANIKGTGKYDTNVTTEIVSAAYNATTLTLAAAGVQGSDAPTRLNSIQRVRCVVPTSGEWKDVVVTAASGATPAVLTFVAPGVAATACNYEILYVPVEPAWATFPARVDETPLRVSDVTFTIGGKWNAGALDGGHSMSTEIESIAHTITNEIPIEFRIGGTGAYANYALLKGRTQTIKVDRQMRDYLLQRAMTDNEYMGVRIHAIGAIFDSPKTFEIDMVFPRCSVLTAPISINDKVVAEAGDLHVHYDATAGKSAQIVVANQVATYAA